MEDNSYELFCEHIEYVLKTYGKSWLEAQYGILVLSKGQSYCS